MTQNGMEYEPGGAGRDRLLTAEQQHTLLQIARQAVEQSARQEEGLPNDVTDPRLLEKAAVFVTLWQEGDDAAGGADNRRLRGCIGRLQRDLPLYKAVHKAAVSAAGRDPRFPPVSEVELQGISIEVAILGPLQPVAHLQEVVIGEDGLVIEADGRRGLLLPKVAARLQWDRADLLRNVCLKAGLAEDTWPGTGTLYRFRTIEFEEDDGRR